MSYDLLTAIFSLVLIVFTMSYLHYKKLKDDRRKPGSSLNELPLFYLFLVGPLFFFILNRSHRRDRKNFMAGKRRFS